MGQFRKALRSRKALYGLGAIILGVIATAGVSGSASALDGLSFDETGPDRYSIDQIVTGNLDQPTINYNMIVDRESLWGYDGQGLVFTNEAQMMKKKDGSPDRQMSAVKRGDSVRISTKLLTERYVDDSSSWPVTAYSLSFGIPSGLSVDESSVVVRVGGNEVDSSGWTFAVSSVPDEEAKITGYTSAVSFELKWAEVITASGSFTHEFLYDDGAEIELEYMLRVGRSADSSSRIMAMYNYRYVYSSYGSTRTGSSDDSKEVMILTDGNLVIRRVDENGKALSGAKYTIEGVKANKSSLIDGAYDYSKTGEISEFTTNDNGEILIIGLPLKDYVVTETEAPVGHETKELEKTAVVAWQDLVNYDYVEDRYNFMGMNITSMVVPLDENMLGFDESSSFTLTYNSETGKYEGDGVMVTVEKTSDGKIIADGSMGNEVEMIYDEQTGVYKAITTLSDYIEADSSTHYSQDVTYLEKNSDGTITLGGFTSNRTAVFTPGEGGCYYGDPAEITGGSASAFEGDAYLCETEGEEHQLTIPLKEGGSVRGYGIHYKYYDKESRYVIDYPMVANTIRFIDDESLTYSGYIVINYYPEIGKYYMGFPPSFTQYEIEHLGVPRILYANEVVFTDVQSEEEEERPVRPEDVVNPQTGDGIVAMVFAVALGAVLGARVFWTKRRA